MRLLLVATVVLWACGPTSPSEPGGPSNEAPRFQPLALGFRPSFVAADEPGLAQVRPGDAPGEALVVTPLPPDSWEHHGNGLWSTPRFAPGADGASAPKLRIDDAPIPPMGRLALRRLDRAEEQGRVPRVPEDTARPSFHLTGARCFLLLPSDAPAPDGELSEQLVLGAEVGGRWRLRLPGRAVDGIPLLAGCREVLTLEAPPAAALRLSARSIGGELTLRVRVDGTLLHESTIPANATTLTVPLPFGDGPFELELEAIGASGRLVLGSPVVGPLEIGGPGDRPWPARRDVVILLADTLRADALAAWGGDPLVTPHLNELASRSRRYLEARTPATWTLPAHAALFSGRTPAAVGIRSPRDELPSPVVTMAEHLRDAGYRTAAVTDGAFVSATFGLDQGFETFVEYSRPNVVLERTARAAAELLDADDGRPLFLFVQSYRPHERGTISPEVEARFAGRFPLPPRVDFLEGNRFERLQALAQATPRGTPMSGPEYEEFVRPMGQYYLGAAAETDLGFERILERLDAHAPATSRVLVFTSDHGESFGEHGVVGHGTGVFDSMARVPLLLVADGVDPGDDRRPASLLDLPRTLCGLVDVVPHTSWDGMDLDAPVPADRPVVVSQHYPSRIEDAAVVVDGRKAVFEADEGVGALRMVYDLRSDPREVHPLGEDAAPLPLDSLRAWIERAHRVDLDGAAADIPAEQRELLESMGYGGDDDGED